jgi:hypothetical protein
MFSKTKVALFAAIVLGTAFPASAATHHRFTRVDPRTDSVNPEPTGGGCSPVRPPFCSNICTGSGACAPVRNY